MLTAWLPTDKGLSPTPLAGDPARLIAEAVWIDAFDITPEEEKQLEIFCGLEVPTRDEMQQLEVSNRLYREGDILYLSSLMLLKTETDLPESTQVTFILTRQRLITVRYADTWSLRTVATRVQKSPSYRSAEAVFVAAIEATVERLADMLQRAATGLEATTQTVFAEDRGRAVDLQVVLRGIGRSGNVLDKIRESLVDKTRLLTFAEQAGRDLLSPASLERMHTIVLDAQALADHASYTAGKSSFLLDGTLGLIAFEQNRVIKIFSIAAVVFLPPTVVGTIYGMNFDHMPELHWTFGYPFALLLMVLSALATLWWFRIKRWL
jgi:magnesium transporter